MEYIAALKDAPLRPLIGSTRLDGKQITNPPGPSELESLAALCERLEHLEQQRVLTENLLNVRNRLAAERNAGSDTALLERLANVCDRLEKLASREEPTTRTGDPDPKETSGEPVQLIGKKDPRLFLNLTGLNGLEAMEAMIQEMGYEVGSGSPAPS